MARKEERNVLKAKVKALTEDNKELVEDIKDFIRLTLIVNELLIRLKDKGMLVVPEDSEEEATLTGLVSTFNKVFDVYLPTKPEVVIDAEQQPKPE